MDDAILHDSRRTLLIPVKFNTAAATIFNFD